MKTGREARRIGLGIKLNLMLIVCILVIALGFLWITYKVYCHKVDSFYYAKAEHIVFDAANYHLPYNYTSYLRKMTDTDEFREVRARAVEANDEQIIRDWMLEQPSYNYQMEYKYLDLSHMTEMDKFYFTLYGDYDTLVNIQSAYIEETFDVDIYLSMREISNKRHASGRWVGKPARDGRNPGVERFGRSWAIPKDAGKPADPRRAKEQEQ